MVDGSKNSDFIYWVFFFFRTQFGKFHLISLRDVRRQNEDRNERKGIKLAVTFLRAYSDLSDLRNTL